MAKKTSVVLAVVEPKVPTGLETSKAKEIKALFSPMLKLMDDYEVEFNNILKLPLSKETAKAAKALRLKYVKVRTGTDKIHKPAKAFYLAGGRFVDGFRAAQRFASQGNEEKLKAIEDYETIKVEAKIAKVRKDREFKLAEYNIIVFPPNLGEWPDEVWTPYIEGVKAKYKLDKEADLQARLKKEEEAKLKSAVSADKDKAIHDLKVKVSETHKEKPHFGHNMEATDTAKAQQFARDLKELRYRYTFKDDRFTKAYMLACQRFEAMEGYFNKISQ